VFSAIISVISCIPTVGDCIAKGVKWLAQGAEWLIKTLPFKADAMDYAARHLPDILSMAKSGVQKLFTGMERAIDEAVDMLYGLLARFTKGSADDAVQAAAGQGAKQTSSEVAEQAARQGGDASSQNIGGVGSSQPQNIYDSVKKSPNYPDEFENVKNGTTKNNIDNQELKEQLGQIEAGKWQKVYKDGYIDGEKVSIHYFESPSGKVFNVKIVQKWSNSSSGR
jgi:hypothetical protein